MRFNRVGIVAVAVGVAAVLCLGACGTASKTRGAAPMPRSTTPTEWGQGAPPWLTQADYDDYVKSQAEEAKEDGITDPPVPIVRWINGDTEYFQVYPACLRQQGMEVSANPTYQGTGTIDVKSPDGQDKAVDHAWWVCHSKYPGMPDKEHGKFSEKTKRVYYDYYINSLIPCLAKHGFVVPKSHIPSFQVFSDEFNGPKDWQPYDEFDNGKMAGQFDAMNGYCPQGPPASSLAYLYDTSSPGD
jgi:hypothetical protein